MVENSYSNPQWHDLSALCIDLKSFIDYGGDEFFIFKPGASVASDADVEGIRKAAQGYYGMWEDLKRGFQCADSAYLDIL